MTITLPIEPPPATELEPQQPAAAEAGQPLHVLILDDERELLHTLVEQLEYLGHSAYGCSSATAAFDVLSHETFDLIISDIRMPGADGPTFYQDVCTRYKSLGSRFIFITGDGLSERSRQFVETKRVPCIFKPFQIKDLENTINHVIGDGGQHE